MASLDIFFEPCSVFTKRLPLLRMMGFKNGRIFSMNEPLLIDVLYFDGCPSWKNALKNLRAALKAENIQAKVHLVLIGSDEEADKEKFPGSPSIRINGNDLWPLERQTYFLSCRMYRTEEGLKGFPSVSMFRERLKSLK
jgi:hypothetical protein